MAYLNFAEAGAGLASSFPAPRRPVETGFSALEWSVIALARNDSLSTLKQPSRLAQAMGTLLGIWRDPRLADGRLEALRRIAVLAWRRGYAIPPSEILAFEAFAFTDEQYELLQASVSGGRRRNEGPYK